MVALDLGCGIGGPLREIARHTGARVVGVNISRYQLDRARKQTEGAGLGHLTDYLECDFMKMDFPDESFDAVFSIETTCCAPDKAGIFGEAFRLLKPGRGFRHLRVLPHRSLRSRGCAAPSPQGGPRTGRRPARHSRSHEVDDALREVGFELLEGRDLAVEVRSATPGISPLLAILGQLPQHEGGTRCDPRPGLDPGKSRGHPGRHPAGLGTPQHGRIGVRRERPAWDFHTNVLRAWKEAT